MVSNPLGPEIYPAVSTIRLLPKKGSPGRSAAFIRVWFTYGIQEIGACRVQRIEGSYFNVVGLPLCEVVELLRSRKVVDPFGPDIS